jgi:luciferase family oxidoreductase group 1
MQSMLKLCVLDQSIAIAGRSQDESIRETIAFARHCEAIGYERFWLAEHHNHDSISGTAPEVLMAAVAATTQSIRVGSAGIMLPNYSTFKIAEQFRVLEAIAPGRIDLGLGRAPGTDRRTSFALNPNVDQDSENFPAHVRDLQAWLKGDPLPEGHVFRGLRAFPTGATVPETWILGSSDYGAQVAAHFGLPYCFAHFITDGRGVAES